VAAVVRDMTEIRRFEAMRRDFVANVSHELRTPITAIQGYAETLLGEGRGAGAPGAAMDRQFLEIIHRHARRLGRLVEDLLRLSALEARREPAPREPVPLGPLVEHVVATVRARPEAAELAIAVEVAPDAVALGDPAGLEEAIENLVDNAVKYGRPGGAVRIQGERAEGRALLRVIDDGPGIAPEHLPRIFERFYRVDPGRSRERGGTGLGLSIVKHLVEAMGGAVRVESDVGKGVRFTLDLPAAS
jgi:two-component system phosphate regulon sensor histidine kinase PhoR